MHSIYRDGVMEVALITYGQIVQEKEKLKKEKEEAEAKFKWALVDGRKEQVRKASCCCLS